jgi:hypothetical protein
MKRPARVTVSHVLWALLGFLYLGIAPDAQAAAPVTDIFQLGLTGIEWCRNDPHFFETFRDKIAKGDTLTVTRDVLGNDDLTDIKATINTNGRNATVDAITMNGLAFPRNKSGMNAELALSGTDPGNPDHFITVRGKAHFDKAGNLTKVTGKFVFQVPVTVNTTPVDCFGDGTFGTGTRLGP